VKRLAACLVLAAGAASAAEPQPPAPNWSVKVHLVSDDARVELRRAAAGLNTTVCKTPCDAVVPFHYNETFTLGGAGLTTSDQIIFPPRDGDLTLRVHATPESRRMIGTGLIVPGAANCTKGAIALAGIQLAGAAVILTGILTLVRNRRTEAIVEP